MAKSLIEQSKGRLLVTGATGFVGRAVCTLLIQRHDSVRGVVHSLPVSGTEPCELIKLGDIGSTTDWLGALDDVNTVIHLAARPHIMHDTAADPLAAFRAGMELVIIRPPLVYGPGAKGNFAALMRAVQRGWPLPLGAVNNRRSLVALDNLVDFIVTCVRHPQAANQTFLVCDGHDLSTPELVRGLARAAGVPVRLLPVPVWALQAGAALLGKGNAVQRLCGNLQVDISKARSLLGWVPPISSDEGLRRTLSGGLPRPVA